MTPEEAITQLLSWQRQIIHGPTPFKDIADCITQLRADNARLRDVLRAVEWQPIETLDRSTYQYVLVLEDDVVMTLLWAPTHGGGWEYPRPIGARAIDVHPTHWMPLPEPPAALGPQPELDTNDNPPQRPPA